MLQPLDVGCFAPMKKSYGSEAEGLTRNKVAHITKIEFLPCFKAASDSSITKSNILRGFRGAGLVPFDPEAVISKLEVRLRTPTPLPEDNSPWEPRTPSNTLEFGYQSNLIRENIQRSADSSSTSVVDALDQLTQGAEMMTHSLVLIRNQVAELQAVNEATTRLRSYKRKRIEQGVPWNTVREYG